MRVQAHDLFLDVAAVHQQGRFLQDSLLICLATDEFLHPRPQFLDVIFKDRFAVPIHTLAGLQKVRHPFSEFTFDATPFVLAHLIEFFQRLFHLGQDGSFQFTLGRRGIRIHRARQAHDDVQVRLGRQAKLRRSSAKCVDIAADQLAIQCEVFCATAPEAESDFYMSSGHSLLQQSSQLHFECIVFRRHAEVQVEEAMIHGLQG